MAAIACEILNPLHSSRWDDLVAPTTGSTVFHSSGWMRVLHESYGYEPSCFVFSRNGAIIALVPVMQVTGILGGKRGVSLPFTDLCPPLFPDPGSSLEVFDWLVAHAKHAGWSTIELRGGGNHLRVVPRSSFFYRHTLDLRGGETPVFSRFREGHRRNIRKGEREGLEVTVEDSWDSVRSFFRLNCLTRCDHGIPPQPIGFFRNLHRHLISPGNGMVVLARHRGVPVAGAIFLHHRRAAVYKYGASDRRYRDLRGNNAVIWEGLRWYLDHGYETLCFGRTEPENEGLRRYKRGWGAAEEEIDYFTYDVGSGSCIPRNRAPAAWQRAICRNMPVGVLRAVGELIYRYAG